MTSRIHIVDDDAAVRDGLSALLASDDREVFCYADAASFLRDYRPRPPECLILDIRMPGMTGMELQNTLARRQAVIPVVFLTAFGDIPTTVRAMKAGAIDFLTKPADPTQLMEVVRAALERSEVADRLSAEDREMLATLASLSQREREVMDLAVAGVPNKDIARRLGISHRTVETHRGSILRKTGSQSVMELSHRLERLRN